MLFLNSALSVNLCLSAQRYIHEDEESNDYVMYDLDELDLNWLQSVNFKRKFRGQCG